jgi:hypothetical protein
VNYRVVWKPSAEAELADLWTGAADRAAVASAADAVEALLERDPLSQGESRAGDDRLLFYPPLSFLFQVDQDQRLVSVLAVGPFG